MNGVWMSCRPQHYGARRLQILLVVYLVGVGVKQESAGSHPGDLCAKVDCKVPWVKIDAESVDEAIATEFCGARA